MLSTLSLQRRGVLRQRRAAVYLDQRVVQEDGSLDNHLGTMFSATQEIFRAQQYLKKWVGRGTAPGTQPGNGVSPHSRGAPGSPTSEGSKGGAASDAQSRWENDQEEESPRTLLRRKVVRGELRELRKEFTDTVDLSIHVATWNVNGRRPSDDLKLDELLDVQNPAGIYVVGFQEIVPLNANNVLIGDMGEAAAVWEALIHETLVEPSKESDVENSSLSDAEKCSLSDDEEPSDKQSRGGQANAHDAKESTAVKMLGAADGKTESVVTNNGKAETSNASTSKAFPDEKGFQDGNIAGIDKQETSSASEAVVNASDIIQNLEAEWHAGAEKLEKAEQLEGERTLRGDDGSKCRGQRYIQIASKQMVGVHVCVWVKRGLRKHVRSVQVSAVGVGLLGVLGNKGSVSVSLLLHETTFCFVCSHLTSGDGEGDESRRSGDVSEIVRRTTFVRNAAEQLQNLPATISEHDQRIWLGDLNYRFCLPDEEVRALVKQQDWETLFQSDQLRIEQDSKQVFVDWQEGKIDFAPTYKYTPGTDRYVGSDPMEEGEKKRTPAWCDRILWRGDPLQQLSYGRAELKTGDHRPVKARFATKADVIVPHKLEALLAKLRAKADAEEMSSRPVCRLSPQTLHLGDIRYGITSAEQPLQIHNDGAVTAEFAFVDVGGSGLPCPPWLRVTPLEGEVSAGEVLEVSVSARVDSASVDLEAVMERNNQLEGILVLRVHGGGDHFVSVSGSYLPSSWGLRLSRLAAFSGPVRLASGLAKPELEGSSEKVTGQTVPKEVIRLLDFLMQPEQAESASLLATKAGETQRGRSPENGEEAEDAEAALAAVREALDTGEDFPLGTSGRTILSALLSLLASLPEPLLSKSILVALEADFATAKREAVGLVEQGLSPAHYGTYELLMTTFAGLLRKDDKNGLTSQTLAAELAAAVFGKARGKEDKKRKQRIQFVKQLLDDRTSAQAD